jgi:hypothetical protein
MPQHLEELGEHVPEERLIIDHEHPHVVVAPACAKVPSVGRTVAGMAGALSNIQLSGRARPRVIRTRSWLDGLAARLMTMAATSGRPGL